MTRATSRITGAFRVGGLALIVALGVIARVDLAHADEAAPTGASATAPSPDQRARAEQLFESALADAQAGNFAAACPKFRASEDADPKTSTLLNLGNCYEKNSQIASAWGAFKEASARAATAGRIDFADIANGHIASLAPKLARISVVVTSAADAPGLVVTRDGANVVRGERGVPIPADAGEHVFSASADGKISWTTKIKIADGQTVQVDVPVLADAPKPLETPLQNDPSATRPPPPAPPGYWSTWRIIGVSAAGTGVIAMTIGAVIGADAHSSYSNAFALCQNGNTSACPANAVTDSHSATSEAGVGTGFFIAGAVLAAAGITTFFLAPKFETKTARVQITPTFGAGNRGISGLAAQGTF